MPSAIRPQGTPLVVAVDGPSGSGKSSVSRAVAGELGMRYLDTGAMYRAVALWMLRNGVDLNSPEAVAARVEEVDVVSGTDPSAPDIRLGADSVADAIREAEVTEVVSRVSAVAQVRTKLVGYQRELASRAEIDGTGIVVEGRDIGSTVLPDADVKVFLTADHGARAARRSLQDNEEGRAIDVSQAADSLAARDKADSSRAASPLTKPDGAVTVDATFLTLDEVVAAVMGLVEDKQLQSQ
ncbi:MAG: (d)CMP kinase [Candidatus Nanopelagicales bacterium]